MNLNIINWKYNRDCFPLQSSVILRTLVFLTFLFSFFTSRAQYTIIGQNSFEGLNIFGPMTTGASSDTFFSRHAYIYPVTTLGQLSDGDTIRSIEFFKSDFNSYSGHPRFRIYLAMTKAADFGTKNISWPTHAAAMTKVYDNDPSLVVDNTKGFKRFDFNIAYFRVDTSKGENLKILVEFIQYQKQALPITWVYENDASVPAFISNNETKYIAAAGKPVDSTNGSNLRKPYIKINFPRYNVNLGVTNVYCLGRVPVLMNRADTIMARINNSGLKTVYNRKIYLGVSGANTFKDSIIIDSVLPYEERIIAFGSYKPVVQGSEWIKVYIEPDDYPFDDVDSVRRIVDYNVYSHAGPFSQNGPGGIGFTGATGDFVAKFYTDSTIYINQIKVDFAGNGREFQLGIWDENSRGLPGNNIFTSDTLMSVAGTYILSVLPKVKIDSGFFVGIRQTSTSNVAFVYQIEDPIRPNAFYFAEPYGDTSWVPFSPGFNFKFNIQPRIQVGNDLAVLRVDYPTNSDTIEYNQFDSIAPKATIINYGFIDQNAPFDVICEIHNLYGKKIYGDTVSTTLKSNDSAQIIFSKSLSRNNYGKMLMRVFTKLPGDKVLDNDTLETEFDIVIRHDVSVETYFEPADGAKFELNVDKVAPVVRVVNNGVNTKKNIMITSRIRQEDKISNVQTKMATLLGTESIIIPFDSFTIPWWGDVTFECFTWGVTDSFPLNDTARIQVYVDKSYDLGVLSVSKPAANSRYERKASFQPYVSFRNFGTKDQTAVPIYAIVKDVWGDTIYSDVKNVDVVKFSSNQILFKNFAVPDAVQTLTFMVKTGLTNDQDPSNDSAKLYFDVVTANDISVKEVLTPGNGKVFNASTSLKPSAVIYNNGNHNITASPIFYCEIRNSKGDLMYLDSTTIFSTLNTGNFDTIRFNKNFDALVKDVYTCKIWHKWGSDGEASNNSITSSFEVSYLKSVKAKSIEIPEKNKIYSYSYDSLTPQISIQNDGLESIYTPINYSFDITGSSGSVYQQTGHLDSLAVGATKTINLPATFILNKTGSFTSTLIIKNSEDSYSFDDTLFTVFSIAKAYDVEATMFLIPGADTSIHVNRSYAPVVRFTNLGDSALSTPFSVSLILSEGTSVKYNTNESITLDSGEQKDVVFSNLFAPEDRGSWSAMAISRLGKDQEKSNDTLHYQFEVTFPAGIGSVSQGGISIFPNPATDQLTIESKSQITRINIYDVNGQVIYSDRINDNSKQEIIHVGDWAKSIYVAEISTTDGLVRMRFVVR
ncbi:MAG: T9SS type A sorting domain-containing protein [Bacteroidetes bacterium]|nr:T9SS type A sorting domain-containing protein [Bacteroidota bacterium]